MRFLQSKLINNPLFTLVFAGIIGIIGGIGSALFCAFTAFFHNLLFLGHFSFIYREIYHAPASLWGIGIIIVPMLGGLVVIQLIERFANDERGLSVPEVMYRVHSKDAKIRPKVALAKALASAISIGSGASIGREGPAIQIGAALSYLLSHVFQTSIEKRKLFVAAGVAASTAAIFNAPFAGLAFSLELFLPVLNLFSIVVLAVSAMTAALINDLLIGGVAIFTVPVSFHAPNITIFVFNLFLFAIFGLFVGLVSIVFIRGVYWFADLGVMLFKSPYLRHIIAMLMVGIMLYFFMKIFGHYYIEGIGFATIQDCLNLTLQNPWFLLLLFVCKLLATCLSLGSGSSGGIFSPALFLGATLGCFVGIVCHALFPALVADPALFTLAGMSGMVSSATGAIVTGILVVFEMTRDLSALWFIIITSIVAYAVRRIICRESIYTLKLARRGISLRENRWVSY